MEYEESKSIAAEEKSDEQLVAEMTQYIQELFRSADCNE